MRNDNVHNKREFDADLRFYDDLSMMLHDIGSSRIMHIVLTLGNLKFPASNHALQRGTGRLHHSSQRCARSGLCCFRRLQGASLFSNAIHWKPSGNSLQLRHHRSPVLTAEPRDAPFSA